MTLQELIDQLIALDVEDKCGNQNVHVELNDDGTFWLVIG